MCPPAQRLLTPSLLSTSQFQLIPLKINLYVSFFFILQSRWTCSFFRNISSASWLSVFLTASNSSFIILCFCSHTQWYFYPWNSHWVTLNAGLPTSDAERNFQQSFFFFLFIFNPMLAAGISGFFRNHVATNSHSVLSVLFLLFSSVLFSAEAATVAQLIWLLLEVKVSFFQTRM